ncbi:MAG: lysostaphin resistance A-like protein [Acetatifactor sp.]
MNEENLQQALSQIDSSDGPTSVYRAGEQKISTGRRVGYFFLSLVPPILCLILQVAALFVVLIPKLVFAIVSGELDTSNQQTYMQGYMELVSGCASLGVFLYHIIGIFVFGLWYYLSFRKPRPTMGATIRKTTLPAILVAAICGVAMCFFSNGTIIVENALFPKLVDNYMQLMEQAGFGVDVFTIIASILLAPIGEEFLCRGLTLKFAKKCFGKFWISNILQAFLFGVIHANWVQGIYAFFIGLVLGYLAERYHTLIPCIILHFVVNFSSTTWISVLFNAMFGDEIPNLFVGLAMVIIPAVIVIALLHKTKKTEGTA